jgi:hypothetical protein
MRPLGKRHAAILDTLTAGLTDENLHRKIDNAPGAFMPAVIEKIGPNRFSVAHYFVERGDLVADPDLELVRQDGAWFPVAVTQLLGSTIAAKTDAAGRIVSYHRRAYADLRVFAGVLLTNIKHQQGIKGPGRAKGGSR